MPKFHTYTAKGRYYKVYKDGEYICQHFQEREAIERSNEIKFDNPDSEVHYTHEYEVKVGLTDAGITEARAYTPAIDQPPTIISTPSVSFTEGVVATYNFAQHVTDDDLSALTYSLTNILPNGLSLDSATGILTYDGIEPATTSQHQLTVADAVGSDTSTSFSIVVDSPVVVSDILDNITLGTISTLPLGPGSNTSDVMYNPNTGYYETVINGSDGDGEIYSVSGDTWTHQGTRDLNVGGTNSSDSEGCCWVTGNRYAICYEGLNIIVLMNGTATEHFYSLPPQSGSNNGLEGVSYASEAELAQGNQPAGASDNGAFFTCQEGYNGVMRIYRVEVPQFDDSPFEYAYDYPADGDALLDYSEFTGPSGQSLDTYLRGLGVLDLASIVYDPRNNDGRLIVVEEQSGRNLHELKITGTNELTYVTSLSLDSGHQWEGLCIGPDDNYYIVAEDDSVQRLTYTGGSATEEAPVIASMTHVVQPIATELTAQPTLSAGGAVGWYLKKGPPSATINPTTGAISWTPSDDLPRGQAVSFRIGAFNSYGHATPVSFIVHVNNTGETGQIHVTGESGISEYIGPAAEQISGGDTLIVTGSARYNSEFTHKDHLNTFIGNGTSGTQYVVPAGSSTQLTTICAEDPYLMIDAAPHDSITEYDNYCLYMGAGQGEYVKFMDFSYKRPQRQVCTVQIPNIFLEGMGFYDAGYSFENTNGRPPQTYAEAGGSYTSLAVVNHTSSTAGPVATDCLTEMCHAGGQGRYMFQNGSGAADNHIRRWCVARPDDYHGDQPRGGILKYSTQGDRDYNCTVIDGDQEDFTAFYKNHAGSFAQPATGNTSRPLDQETERCGVVNTQMPAIGLMDADSGVSQAASWTDHWSYDTESQSAPQTGNTGTAILQSSSQTCDVVRASIGPSPNHEGSNAKILKSGDITFTDSILDSISGTEDMFGGGSGSGTFTGGIYNYSGALSASGWSVTNSQTGNPRSLGWEYLPRIEAGSTYDTNSIGAQAAFLKGKLYHRKGDADDDTNTSIPAWPHPMEDVFRTHNKAYAKTGLKKRVDEFGTYPSGVGDISGDRGFCVDNETYTEYVWGYLGFMLPPLRISHRVSGSDVTFYNAPLESFREDNRTGWRIYKTTDTVNPVATVNSRAYSTTVSGLTSGDYFMTNTFSTYTPSTWMNGDESGRSIQTLTVTI